MMLRNKFLRVSTISCFFIFQSSLCHAQNEIFGARDSITNGRTWDLAFEDLNKDGSPDFVMANFDHPPTIYYNDGTGGFDNFVTLACIAEEEDIYRGHSVAINDFNNDKNPDIFMVFNTLNNLIYLGDKTGKHPKPDTIQTNKSNGLYIAIGDIDNDNDMDAFITNYNQASNLWLNNGDGKFTESNFNFGSGGYNIELGDLNNDGFLDVISSINGKVIVWLNKGQGDYERSTQNIGYAKGYGEIKLADMDNDEDLDVILANTSFGASIWLNDGRGIFTESVNNLSKSSKLTIGDIDLDGKIDLIIGNTIWLNNENNKFGLHRELDNRGLIIGLWLHDIDNDGDLDLFYSEVGKAGGGLFLMKNTVKSL